MIEPVSIPVTEKLIQDASYYAYKVVFGSFRQGMKARFGGGIREHMAGKLGELAFFKFCLENGIPVKHAPFRDDYTTLNDDDDFILVLNGKLVPVEVKTATVLDPMKLDKPLFYNKKQYDSREDHKYIIVFTAVNKHLTQVCLVGWIHAKRIAKFPVRKDLRSPAYEIAVEELKPMQAFLRGSS